MKWITSFPLILFLSVTFLAFNAYQITQPNLLSSLLGTNSTLIPETLLSSFSNPQAHAFLGKILLYSSFVSFFLLICLVFFSYRFGKISNIGCAFFVTALPGTLLFRILKNIFSQGNFNLGTLPPSFPLPIDVNVLNLYSESVREIGILIFDFMYRTYLFITILGFVFIILALISLVVWKIFHKNLVKESSYGNFFIICLLSAGIGIFLSIFFSIPSTPTTTQGVTETLKNPAYNTPITVEGEVSRLGELSDPCFYLISKDAELEVCQRPENLYSYPEDTTDWDSIHNGGFLDVTGKLIQNEKTEKPVLWIDSITPLF